MICLYVLPRLYSNSVKSRLWTPLSLYRPRYPYAYFYSSYVRDLACEIAFSGLGLVAVSKSCHLSQQTASKLLSGIELKVRTLYFKTMANVISNFSKWPGQDKLDLTALVHIKLFSQNYIKWQAAFQDSRKRFVVQFEIAGPYPIFWDLSKRFSTRNLMVKFILRCLDSIDSLDSTCGPELHEYLLFAVHHHLLIAILSTSH